MQRVVLALLLLLGVCLTGFAQNSKPSPITKELLELRLKALQRDREQAIANVNAYDGAIQECQFWLELLKDAEQEETMIEFPKWKYHKDGKAQIVQNAEGENALGSGWADSPAAFQAAPLGPPPNSAIGLVEHRPPGTKKPPPPVVSEVEGKGKKKPK